RGARVEYTQVPPTDTWAAGPVRFVRALLQNLFVKSVKYGAGTISIQLKCRRDAPSANDKRAMVAVFVEVADLGGGLPGAQKQRLQRALGHNDTQGATRPKQEQGEERASAGLNVLAHALRQLGGRMEVLDRGVDGAPVSGPGAE